jgi:hypothetical protein
MSGPVVAFYRCRRCKEAYEAWHAKPMFCASLRSSYSASCPNCGKGGTPYEVKVPGKRGYPLPEEQGYVP